ncbi:hypothetical protein [Azospirillum halopraeferens]|uniref:hypothetical protein n=1 Tax=Azospirillum halopraeferens TaxID=34010 RepID=UPI000409CB2F|nr:hypothetical protein [Azospirillum halopraeferens]
MTCAPPPDACIAARLADLERRHEGPPPAGAVRIARLGRTAAAVLEATAVRRHHAALAAEAHRGAARRRAALSAAAAAGDIWLARLALALAHHRTAALGRIAGGDPVTRV